MHEEWHAIVTLEHVCLVKNQVCGLEKERACGRKIWDPK